MTIEIKGNSADDAIITMTHTLDAPRALVWEAFTDPKHVVHWYGGNGFSNPVCEMDVRPGGQWNHVMVTPDGTEYRLHYVFLEVVKPEKLSWQSRAPHETAHGKEEAGPSPLNTMTFEEDGRRTKIKLVARFGTIAERNMAMSFGFAPILREGVEKMGRLLEGLQKERSHRAEPPLPT